MIHIRIKTRQYDLDIDPERLAGMDGPAITVITPVVANVLFAATAKLFYPRSLN